MKRIYLDWASTSPMSENNLKIYTECAAAYPGNPSSIHTEGKNALEALEDNRRRIARLVNVQPQQIVFTSGGTESNAIVLGSFLQQLNRSGAGLIIPSFEHPAVWEYGAYFQQAGAVVSAYTCRNGSFDLARFTELINKETRLVCCMSVHNETGTLFPIKELAAAVRDRERALGRKIHIHTDAVQAAGKCDITDLFDGTVDSASFSGHKIEGPRGVGMLYLRKPIPTPFPGGGQEQGIRPGTENLPAIAGFTSAFLDSIKKAGDETIPTGAEALLLEGLASCRGLTLLPRNRKAESPGYVPSIVMATASPLPSEVLIRALNDRGFSISAGSACSNRKGSKKRRALEGMGISSKDAEGAFRVSIGPSTTKEEIELFLSALQEELQKLSRAF
jgi:cysteine desulfurase